MPIPQVTPDQITTALNEFDEKLRTTEEWRDWEANGTYRYALVVAGKRYPPKKIISLATGVSVREFSGGPEANGYLERLGFQIMPLAGDFFQKSFEKILEEYATSRATQPFAGSADMAKLFKDLVRRLHNAEEVKGRESIKVEASVGRGNWAKVPWIAFLDEHETDSTTHGVYVVILFRQDGSGLYLTFNQGTTEPRQRLGETQGIEEVRERAQVLRTTAACQALESAGFQLDDNISLNADSNLARSYEPSTIAYKLYEKGQIPDDTTFFNDVTALLRCYDEYLSKKSTASAARPAVIHMLLKWAAQGVPDTIQRHKSIAESKGSVWWGKFGKLGIGAERLRQIQAQLDRGEKTFVFLSGSGTVWRTTLEAIATAPAEIDRERLPQYYQPEQYALFVRVRDFEETSVDWMSKNAVGDTMHGTRPVENLLNGLANPAYLRLSDEAGVSKPVADLCLIGSGKNPEPWIQRARAMIRDKGACASWWSFSIKREAKSRLRVPFYLYLNTGGDDIRYRQKVEEYVGSESSAGIESPWADITLPEVRDKTQASDASSGVFRTWLKVTEIEDLRPSLTTKDFRPAEGLSGAGSLLNANAFGYAYRLNPTDEPADEPLDEAYASPALLDEITAALAGASPQIVLAGPPGTSKTWIAQLVARRIAGASDRVRLVQFHPSFSYEAFVEGLRPVSKQGQGISFEQTPGILLQVVDMMRRRDHLGKGKPNYVLIIDEMNRANLARVFGELMFLFEYRDREIQLQYGATFVLPPNLKFIATMNTADRSIRSIDIALRRRFDVFELPPEAEVLERYFEDHSCFVENLVEGFERINADLQAQLDRHHRIGHAFFMRDGLDRKALSAIWERKIFPLIEEYFFDQLDVAASFAIDKYWPETAA